MVFGNLIGNVVNGEIARNGGKSFPLVVENMLSNVCDSTVRVFNNKIYITNSNKGSNIFELKGKANEIATKIDGAKELTYKDLQDTDDNPLIVVATKGIKFYNSIPTYLDVLYVNDDMMLVMLIYGACEFLTDTGDFLPLIRCMEESELSRKGTFPTVYTPNLLKEMTIVKTEGGWDKTYEIVCPMYVRVFGECISIRCIKENANIINPEGIKTQESYEEKVKKEKEEAFLRKQKEREEKKRLAYLKQQEANEEKKKREEAEKLEKERLKKMQSAAKRNASKSKKENVPTHKVSAMDFLNIVNNIDK